MIKRFRNERYQQEEYVYGKDPNEYLKAKLKGQKPVKNIFPADGEGRNSVYVPQQGSQDSAFNINLKATRNFKIR